MKKAVKKIIKFIGWALAAFTLLLLIVFIALQTSFVKAKIVIFAQKQVGNILNADLKIGKLSGNMFTNIKLKDVVLTSAQNDTIAYIPAMRLRYRLLPLLKKTIMVREITIDNPYIFLEQMPDSTWNLQHITKPPEANADTTATQFGMHIQLKMLQLNNGHVRVKAYNTQIPQEINNLNIGLKGSYSTAKQEIDLYKLDFTTSQPQLQLKTFTLQAKADTAHVNLAYISIETAHNRITGRGEYFFDNNKESFVQLNTNPIILDEFKAFLSPGLVLQAKPILVLEAQTQGKNLTASLLIDDNGQAIDLKLITDYLIDYIADPTTTVNYDLTLGINKVDLRYWLNNPDMQYVINGLVKANGKGFDPKTLKANITADFGNVIVYGKQVRKLNLLLNYNAGNINGLVNGNGTFGYINIKPYIHNITSERPQYRLALNARNINIAVITGDENYITDINLDATINGSGIDLKKINAKSHLEMYPSEIMGIRIDTFNTNIDLINRNVIINSLLLKSLDSQLQAAGNYSLVAESELNVALKIDSIQRIATLLGIDSITTSANITADITGVLNDLYADVDVKLGNTQYKNIVQLDTFFAQFNTNIMELGKTIDIAGELQANGIMASGFRVDSAKVKAESDLKNTNMSLNINSKDINGYVNGEVEIGDTINTILSSLWVDYKGYNWHTDRDNAYITITPDEYKIGNFKLMADSLQTLFIDGKVSRTSNQDLQIQLINFKISEAVNIFSPETDIDGVLNMGLKLHGTAQSPALTGRLNADSTMFQSYIIKTLNSDVLYNNNELSLKTNIIPQDNGQITLTATIPAEMRIDSLLFNITPTQTDSVLINLLVEKLPLSIINIFIPTDEVQGFIESNISVGGTFGKPDIKGNVNVAGGRIALSQYGVNYRDITVEINANQNAVTIDTIYIKSNDGTLQASGDVLFDSEIYKTELNASNLEILFNRFNLVDHKLYNMELNGNVDLTANKDSIYFSGDLTIPEMELYLPAIMALMGTATSSDIPKPLLLIELQKDSLQTDSIVYTVRPDTAGTNINRFEFLNNLQGGLKLKIPRNTWIKNEEMRFEISGDLELIKNKEFFEIFGTIDVLRGQYSMLGKTFIIQSGTITFQGGDKINPILNVDAQYSFRDGERTKHDLQINITGDMSSPEIKFKMEDANISEGDAISYILFGMNMDALTSGQKESVGSGVDAVSLTQNLAASLVSSQLTKLLGNTLDVDYIEFKGSGSFDNASFVVGKYITNKLFISYEQTIGHIEDEDAARYQMTMEYELFKFLFLQLASSSITNGFDVVFKLNSKVKPAL